MSDTPNVGTVLVSVVSVAGLWVLLAWFYQQYRMYKFRSEMFVLRDRLFDLAASGAIAFDAPAYAQLRDTLNGFIRFAHRLSITSAFLIARRLAHRGQPLPSTYDFAARWARNTEPLDPVVRHALNDLLTRANLRVVDQLLLGSPVFLAMLWPFVAWLVLQHMSRRIISGLRLAPGRASRVQRMFVDSVDEAALQYGMAV